MTFSPTEFVCLDCKSHVFRYYGDAPKEPELRCFNCTFIRGLELSPETEAEMRKILDCELREEGDDLCEQQERAIARE